MGKLLIMAAGMSSRMKKDLEGSNLDQNLIQQANLMPKGMIGVGNNGRPFMDYQLFNAYKAGYKEVVIVVNIKDQVTRPYFEQQMLANKAWGLNIKYAIQHIPHDREKPLGTADGVQQALEQHPEWENSKFTVCNSDNLYSVNVLKLLLDNPYPAGLISYEASGLGFGMDKVKNCAILFTNQAGFLKEIIEKPEDEQVEMCIQQVGRLGISMNIFSMEYGLGLKYMSTQMVNAARNEKELPEAIGRMAAENENTVMTFPVAEAIPDLTSKADIAEVQNYLKTNYPEL